MAGCGKVPWQYQCAVAYELLDVEVLYLGGIERGTPADDAVYFVPFFDEKFGQIGAILTIDSGDQSFFVHG